MDNDRYIDPTEALTRIANNPATWHHESSVYARDVLERMRRREALRGLVELTEELGLYDE